MITYDHPLGTIKVPETKDSLEDLYRLRQQTKVWAADTETTGLNPYVPGFRVRIVQVGTTDEAWILRPEHHMQAIADLTGGDGRPTWWHNWVFDALAMETSLGLDFDATFTGAQDTDITSRLLDPRPPQKGGVGHKLETLAAHHLGLKGAKKDARDAVLAECKRIFGSRGCTADEMWTKIPVDNPEYQWYAGQDVLITARLAPIFQEQTRILGLDKFYQFERPLSWRLAQMQRQGMRFDGAWASKVEAEYDEVYSQFEQELAEEWDIIKGGQFYHSANAGLVRRFEQLGVKWQKRSDKTGKPSLDKAVIRELMAFGKTEDIRKLATAVNMAKRNKHYGDYVRGMRDHLGVDGRVHPNVRPMQAATHRMSASDPAVQQFPRDDPRVRGCLTADEEEDLVTGDYAQVEYRVGAGVSQDPVMIKYIRDGHDIHGVAAMAMFGKDFNKGQRQASKPVGLGRLYLGGAAGIYRQLAESDTTGYLPTLAQVRKGARAFDVKFSHYNRWARRLKDKVEMNNGVLITATGRRLIVSPSYAAPNYNIQSVARDVLAAAINRLWKAGIGRMLRLVVHDELVVSAPKKDAEEVKRILIESMVTTFKGVPIDVEADIKGERWAK